MSDRRAPDVLSVKAGTAKLLNEPLLPQRILLKAAQVIERVFDAGLCSASRAGAQRVGKRPGRTMHGSSYLRRQFKSRLSGQSGTKQNAGVARALAG